MSFRPWELLPWLLVSGNRVFRAMTMDVVLEDEPPWTEMPPAWAPVRPKRFARARVVCFSISVSAGDTSYV